ncbi:MAG: HEAT repeat domain-containing protein [Verrucomicrobiae bacterium]|nr:HEAT repeat domain-containing protein [Verrucomicrobiae bacterium]
MTADEASALDEMVERRVAALEDLAMEDDPASLNVILTELHNGNKTIRKAALEATIQFADRAAIPYLEDLADRTEDPLEQVELLEAIEFLSLPSLTEVLEAHRASGGTVTPPAAQPGQDLEAPASTSRRGFGRRAASAISGQTTPGTPPLRPQ